MKMPPKLKNALWIMGLLLVAGIAVAGELAAVELAIFVVIALVGGVLYMVFGGNKNE